MLEIFEIFSLTTEGDVPIGLTDLRRAENINQPALAEQRQTDFTPLFKSPMDYSYTAVSHKTSTAPSFDLSWLSFTTQESD